MTFCSCIFFTHTSQGSKSSVKLEIAFLKKRLSPHVCGCRGGNEMMEMIFLVLDWRWSNSDNPQLLSGNHFSAEGYHDLGLWPSDLKINRGHLLLVTNLHTKYEVPGPKQSSVIERKPFFSQRSPWPWPTDIKINRGHLQVSTKLHTKYEVPGYKRSWVIE